MGLVVSFGLVGLLDASEASAQGLRPTLPTQPGSMRAGSRGPGFNAPMDVYPALVNARVTSRLPVLTPAQLGDLAPADVHVRVRIVLDGQGAVTVAEVERASVLPGFDALVIETLSRFRGPLPGLSAPSGDTYGALPLPKDQARLQLVTTRGLAFEVRARAQRPVTPAPAPTVPAPAPTVPAAGPRGSLPHTDPSEP